jgi:hypothetical protein
MRTGNSVWIPIGFTALYLASAIAVGAAIDRGGGWIALGTPVALAFAIVSALVFWLIYGVVQLRRTRPIHGILILTGFLCPVVIVMSVHVVVSSAEAFHESRTTRQIAHSRISNVSDEPLLTANGNPIGVRIRYTVQYDDGLDDLHYAPIAQVGTETPALYFNTLSLVSNRTTPKVTGAYGKGTYEFTEDFVPGFSPRMILFNVAEPCFIWYAPTRSPAHRASQEATLDSVPQHFRIVIEPYRYTTRTANAYAYRTFYEGQMREGAKECE